MADVAAVFHWSPDLMDMMEPEELLRWRGLARERAGLA
ncbi:GpE family phage tail protein [Azospirillum cavernae]|uniref:GpE family phage tail protein n=1 Tax=Azospirillum cavernae TaxID=2320860 RepID=A0A418VYZ7_9PROT|nr:GpE family phage tail protein [Azospirillum cavernae]RJF82340.1 GpE family phage tail protein [Azospirillum cavernae]